jgi:hypothetical protein
MGHIVSEPNFQAGPICATVAGNLSHVEQPAAAPNSARAHPPVPTGSHE